MKKLLLLLAAVLCLSLTACAPAQKPLSAAQAQEKLEEFLDVFPDSGEKTLRYTLQESQTIDGVEYYRFSIVWEHDGQQIELGDYLVSREDGKILPGDDK